MIPIAIKNIFPKSKISQFDPYYEEIKEYCQLNNKQREATFWAECGIETGGIKIFIESTNYSAQGLAETFPNRYAINPKSPVKKPNSIALSLHRKPYDIAELTYNGRMGNNKPGDGYKYRGHALPMLTGKDAYIRFTNDLGLYLQEDFVNNVDAILTPKNNIYAGAWFFKSKGIAKYADKGDIKGASKAWNGGFIHLPERIELYNKILKVI